jgi:hypothetical protein
MPERAHAAQTKRALKAAVRTAEIYIFQLINPEQIKFSLIGRLL